MNAKNIVRLFNNKKKKISVEKEKRIKLKLMK